MAYSWRPIELRDPLGVGIDKFDKGLAWGRDEKFQREAPEQFAQAAAPLSEFGLTTPPDQLREMFRNPETRALAIQQVQEATQRRADASDPMKQIQLQKAQIDLRNAQRGPAGPAPTAEMRNWQQAQNDPKFAEFIGINGLKNAPDIVKQYAYYRDQAIAAGEQPIGFLEFKNYAPTEAPKPQTDLAKLKADLQAGLITPEQYNTAAANTLASGEPKPEQPLTSLAKLKADLDAGRITADQYKGAVAKELQGSGGLSVTTNPDGTVSVQQGGGTGPKLTEGQSKDAFYYIRGAGANKALEENEASLTSLSDTVAGGMPLVGNYFTSDGFKNANRDGKEFLASVLRKDSGGAITPDEWSYYGPMYLPAPGDGPDQLSRKRDARKRAMEALKATSGPGQVVIDEYDRQNAPPATDGAAPPVDWQGSPDLWQYLTPEERALWQN